MTRAHRVVSLVLSAAFVATACSGATTASAPTTTAPSSSPSGAVDLLAFEGPLLAGGTFRGTDLAGKDVAFWFWAPW